MSTLQTVSISVGKIKVRREEPYTSEALNKALSAMPRGVYRGGYVVPTSPDSTSFKLVPDNGDGWYSDTFFATRDKSNGFLLTVTDISEVTFDMSAQFPLSGAKEWAVIGEVTYTVGSATVGNYKVIDWADLTDDDKKVVFAKINLTGAESVIAASSIEITGIKTTPEATKIEEDGDFDPDFDLYLGMLSGLEAWRIPTLNQKKALNAATSPSDSNPFITKSQTLDKMFAEPSIVNKTGLAGTKVQLTGKTVYVGKGAVGTAQKYFSLRDNSNIENILRSNNNIYEVVAIYDSADTDELIPSSEADADGYYIAPWVYFNASYTGDLNVACFEKKDYSTISGFASQIISTLLKFNKGKMDSVDSDSSPANYKLLWRSHNALADSAVTKNTSSIYIIGGSNGGMVFLTGGYIDDSGEVYAGTGSDSDDVVALLMISGSNNGQSALLIKDSPVVGTNWTLTTMGDWDQYIRFGPTSTTIDNPLLVNDTVTLGTASYIKHGSSAQMRLLYELEDVIGMTVRIYAGYPGATGPASLHICYNVSWFEASDVWLYDAVTYDSFMIRIGNEGIAFFYHDSTAGSSWNDSSWSSEFAWAEVAEHAGKMLVMPDIKSGYDVVQCAFQTYASKAFSDDEYMCLVGQSYHGRWNSTSGPTTLQGLSGSWDYETNVDPLIIKTVTGVSEQYGFEVIMKAQGSVADGDSIWVEGLIEAYT